MANKTVRQVRATAWTPRQIANAEGRETVRPGKSLSALPVRSRPHQVVDVPDQGGRVIGLRHELPVIRDLVGMRTGIAGGNQQHVRPAPVDLLGEFHAVHTRLSEFRGV